MPTITKDTAKDEVRLGSYAAKQPLSGVSVVTKISVKGGNGTSRFCNAEETKRAS